MCTNFEKYHIVFAVRKLFKSAEQDEVLNALNLDSNKAFRTCLAVLKLSKGNLKEFYVFLKKAEEDYRDVIWWAEYDEKDREKKLENPYKEILE